MLYGNRLDGNRLDGNRLYGNQAAEARYFALYLPDGLPLMGKNARLELDLSEKLPEIRLVVTIDQDSALDLIDSALLGELELPVTETALETYWVELTLTAKDEVCRRFSDFISEQESPAVALLDGKGPALEEGQDRSALLIVDAYNLEEYAVHQQNLASDEVIALAKQPPEPL